MTPQFTRGTAAALLERDFECRQSGRSYHPTVLALLNHTVLLQPGTSGFGLNRREGTAGEKPAQRAA